MTPSATHTGELELVTCPLCGSDQFEALFRARDLLYGVPGEFQIVRCKPCAHTYLNPRPTRDTIGDLYPNNYRPHHAHRTSRNGMEEAGAEGGARPWYLTNPLRNIPGLRPLYHWLTETRADYIPHIEAGPRMGLEIGCADGLFLERLRDSGWQVAGVEPAREPALAARARGLKVHVGTLESANWPTGTFHAVFAHMVMEHLHDPKGTFREIRRILRSDGWLVFSVPNAGAWELSLFREYWHGLHAPYHLQHFSLDGLRDLLRMTDFSMQQVIFQCNAINIVGSIGAWLQCRYPNTSIGRRFIDFTDYPSVWGQLALSPLAKFLAWIGQAGRLTIIALPSGK